MLSVDRCEGSHSNYVPTAALRVTLFFDRSTWGYVTSISSSPEAHMNNFHIFYKSLSWSELNLSKTNLSLYCQCIRWGKNTIESYSISAKSKYLHHEFKSIWYRIGNIFIGSCSIFLWINSLHAFSRNAIGSIAFFSQCMCCILSKSKIMENTFF